MAEDNIQRCVRDKCILRLIIIYNTYRCKPKEVYHVDLELKMHRINSYASREGLTVFCIQVTKCQPDSIGCTK